jgi:hypothetical protein
VKYLIALLYLSTARDKLDEKDMSEILEASRKNNKQEGITGILCSGGNHFIQVLEGPQKAVLKRYLIILDDDRHKDSMLIGVTPLTERIFSEWLMGYINVGKESMLERRDILIKSCQDKNQENGKALVQTMRSLING